MARSEFEHSDRNAAIAYLMKSFGNFDNDVLTVLQTYFHYCALRMSCVELARSFVYLANQGRTLDGEEVISPLQARQINALMMTSGMYDGAGEFAYRVGMPGKSGVGGGIIAIVPDELSIVVWSPELDASGNSLAGTAALELLSQRISRSIFNSIAHAVGRESGETMLKRTGLALLLLTASQAHAEYQCSVRPQDDVIISPQTVQVVGAGGNLQITADGDVTRDGKALSLNDNQRQKAFSYQNALRKDLPWMNQGAQQHLEKARVALDKVIVQELGTDSNVRNRLTTLNDQLKQQMNRIIEHRSDGLTFHHKAIAQVEQDGRNIVQQSMGGVLQDSLNEMGVKQVANSNGNPLQAIMGNLGGLQQAIKNEWNNQEQDFQNFGRDVCKRVTALETQRKDLVKALN